MRKLTIVNRLFLDMEHLSKNMQVLLNNYELTLNAQVESISEHVASSSADDYGIKMLGLQPGEAYARCRVSKVDHIVNYTSRILGK